VDDKPVMVLQASIAMLKRARPDPGLVVSICCDVLEVLEMSMILDCFACKEIPAIINVPELEEMDWSTPK